MNGIHKVNEREAGLEQHGEESKMQMSRGAERLGMRLKSWLRIELNGEGSCVTYTLRQGEKGNDDDDDDDK